VHPRRGRCGRARRGYRTGVTEPDNGPDEVDQDAEPTMTAPPGQRPDAGASELDPGGRADNPDVVDADDGEAADPVG
jgi:hypothetical protein